MNYNERKYKEHKEWEEENDTCERERFSNISQYNFIASLGITFLFIIGYGITRIFGDANIISASCLMVLMGCVFYHWYQMKKYNKQLKTFSDL